MRLLAMSYTVGSFLAMSQAALAFMPNDSQSLRYAQESAGAALPAPGQKLIRTATKQDFRENVFLTRASGNVLVERDVIGNDLRLLSGKLGFNLADLFGSLDNADRWISYQSQGQKNRKDFAKVVARGLQGYLLSQQQALKLNPKFLRLNDKKLFVDKSTLLASFDVVIGGVLVKGSSVDFRFSKGELVQIAIRSFGAMQSDEAQQAASTLQGKAKDPQKIATKVLGPEAKVRGAVTPVIFVQEVEGKYRFEPAIEVEASSASGEAFRIVESAVSGNILEWYSLHLKFEAKVEGVVNERTVGGRTLTVGLPFIQGTYKAGGAFGLTKTVKGNAEGFLKGTGNISQLTVGLVSDFFKITNMQGNAASIKTSGDALFDAESNSTLAETSGFYHANVVRSFAKKYITTPWFDEQVAVKVNINDFCNAYWDGQSINFFQAGSKTSRGQVISCNNTAEIADVVYHEYGHGLDQNTGGIDDGAYSEGIGDITAMLITDSPLVGPGFMTNGKEVRNLEGDYKYPPTNREVHYEGLIIGSTWYDLTKALKAKYGETLGRDKAAGLFFKSLFTTSQYVDVYNALLALNSNGASPDLAPDFCLINTAFAGRGLAKKDASCRS